jgi:hypothetical protein
LLEQPRERTHPGARNPDQVDLQGAQVCAFSQQTVNRERRAQSVADLLRCVPPRMSDPFGHRPKTAGRPAVQDDDAGGESRRNFRPATKYRWPIELQIAGDAADSRRIQGITYGVSVGGAFIESDWMPEIGTAVHVWLRPLVPDPDLPDELRLQAEVRWRSAGERRDVPRGFGVQFRALTATDEVTLHGYFSAAHKVV